MRVAAGLWMVTLVLGTGDVVTAAQAVAPSAGGVPVMISGKSFALGDYPMYVQGQPFVLESKVTVVRAMPDGTVRTNETVETAYRDSEGRFRLESHGSRRGGPEVVQITIFDPVALTSVRFSRPGHTATLTHVAPRSPATGEDLAKAEEQRVRSEAYRREHPGSGAEEALGTRVIAGQQVEGMRTTMVAAPMGADGGLRIVREKWTSPVLGIPLSVHTENSRSGETTREATKLERIEPGEDLFRLPPGYTIQEQARTALGSGGRPE